MQLTKNNVIDAAKTLVVFATAVISVPMMVALLLTEGLSKWLLKKLDSLKDAEVVKT